MSCCKTTCCPMPAGGGIQSILPLILILSLLGDGCNDGMLGNPLLLIILLLSMNNGGGMFY